MPRLLEFHHICKGAAGIEKATCEDQDNPVGCSVFQHRDYIAIGNIFAHHFADSDEGVFAKSAKPGPSWSCTFPNDASLAGPSFHWVLITAENDRAPEAANPIVTSRAPRYIAISRIVILLNESKNGTFQ